MATITIGGTGGAIEGNLGSHDVNVNLDSALYFSGDSSDSVSDHVTMGDNDLITTGSFTLSAWIRPLTNTTHGATIIGKQQTYNTNALGYGLYWRASTNVVYFNVGDGSNGDQLLSGDLSGHVDSWIHIAGTYNATSKAMVLYVNGVSVDTGTASGVGDLSASNSHHLRLGANGTDPDEGDAHFKGYIADARIYSYVHDQPAIARLAAKINVIDPHADSNYGLVGWWKCNDGSGSNIVDHHNVGTDFDGTFKRNDAAYSTDIWKFDQYYVDVYDNSTTTDGTFTVTQGKVEGKALSTVDLDGAAEYIRVGDNDGLSFGDGSTQTPFSLAAWINMDDATNFKIMSKGILNTNGEYQFHVDGSDLLEFRVFDESVNDCHLGRKFLTALTTYQDEWIHVVATSGATTESGTAVRDTMKLYLNGVRVDNDNSGNAGSSFDAMENSSAELYIGRYDNHYADGSVRDARVYDRELSAEDVASLYSNTSPQVPYLHWKLDEGHTTESAVDAAGAFLDVGTKGSLGTNQFNRLDAAGVNLDASSCINGTLDLDGNLTIAANGSLSLPRGNLDLASNLDVNCTTVATQFIHNNGKVVLSSTSSENELYTGGATFYNVDKTGSVRARLFENMTVENVLDMTSSTSYFDLDADGSATSFTLTMGTATSSGTIESHDAGRFRIRSNNSRLITVQGVSTLYPCNVTGNDWDWDATVGSQGIQLANMDFQVDVVTNDGGVKLILTGDCEFDALTVSDGDTFDVNGQRVEFGGDVTYLSGSTFDADGLMVFRGGFTKYGTLNNAASSDILSFSSSGTPAFSFITGYRTFFAGAGVQLGTGGFSSVSKAIIAGNLLTGTRDTSATTFSLASGGTFDANDNTLTVSGDFNSAGGLIGKSAADFINDSSGSTPTNGNFITAGSAANSDGWGNITVECWVKLDHLGKMGSETTFFSRGGNSSPKFGLYAGKLRFYANAASKAFGGTGDNGDPSNQETLVTDRWYHVAMTYNNTTGVGKHYVNGRLDSQATIDAGCMPSDVAESIIGAQSTGNRHMDGLMGKISVWDHELTQAEIRKLMFMTGAEMQADNTNFPDATANDCKFFYNFDEGTGDSITDSGPGGNNATWGTRGSQGAAWASNGTYTRDTSTLVMSGAAGTLTHGHGQTFYNLTLAPSGGDTTVNEVRGAGYDIVIDGLLTCGGGTLNNVGTRSRFQLEGTVNFGGTSFTNVSTLIDGADLFTIPYKTGTTAQTFAALSIRAETELNGDIIVTGAFDYGGSNESLRTRGYDCTFNGSTTAIGSGHTFKAEAGTIITMGHSNGWVNSSGTMQLWGENAAAFPSHANNTLTRANDTALQFGTGDFSISFWYKSNDSWDREHQILGNANFYLHLNNAGASAEKLRAYMGDAYVDTGAFNSARLHQNWNHFVVTFDRNDLLKVYVNGSYEANVDISGKSGQDIMNSGNLTIGEANATSGRGWNGSLVDLRFFKGTVLTDGGVSVGQAATGNVASLYNSGLNPATLISSNGDGGYYASDSPTATSWWKLGNTNASGARATAPALDLTDSSSGSLTLTNSGGVKAGSIFMTKSSGSYSITDSNDTLIMNWRNCKINMNANTELYVSSASQFSGRITLD